MYSCMYALKSSFFPKTYFFFIGYWLVLPLSFSAQMGKVLFQRCPEEGVAAVSQILGPALHLRSQCKWRVSCVVCCLYCTVYTKARAMTRFMYAWTYNEIHFHYTCRDRYSSKKTNMATSIALQSWYFTFIHLSAVFMRKLINKKSGIGSGVDLFSLIYNWEHVYRSIKLSMTIQSETFMWDTTWVWKTACKP